MAAQVTHLDAPVAGRQWLQSVLVVPFDLARAQYAAAVRLGLIERSMLQSNKFFKTLDSLEHATLGSLARSV